MTLKQLYACQVALKRGRGAGVVSWTIWGIGAACLASSAALTWGTPASILAGIALAAFIFCVGFNGQIGARHRRRAYVRYRESDTTYTFTSERIVTKSRKTQCFFTWAAVERVVETSTFYLLAMGDYSFIPVLKRDIPPQDRDAFLQLLSTHRLLGQAQAIAR